jgi:hypothetical protein
MHLFLMYAQRLKNNLVFLNEPSILYLTRLPHFFFTSYIKLNRFEKYLAMITNLHALFNPIIAD